MRYIILKPYKIMHYKITHLLDCNCRTTSITTTQDPTFGIAPS